MLISAEMVISGFVSKVINDCADILKDKIQNADNNRKSGSQNLETRIYQVTIDALNEFTKNKYEGKDALYDAAECILRGFKNTKCDNTEAVRKGLEKIVSQVTSNVCEDFLGILCHEICRDENDVLFKEVSMIQQEQAIENMKEGFKNNDRNHEETHNKLAYVKKGIDYIKENISSFEERKLESKIYVKNRAEEYAEKWDKNVFLNDFNEEDENAGAEIKLSELYKENCLPHYIWKKNTEPSDKSLRNLLEKYVINNDGKKMLLILGQPGIGKSTLITWIIANLVEEEDKVFVYQFARDLKKINWHGDDIFYEILNALMLKYDELENKVLIIDGFDEIYTSGDRERILNKINQSIEGLNYLKKFSLIITCRENYVSRSQLTGCDYITLQAWDVNQIKSFCEIYEKEIMRKKPEIKKSRNSEVKIEKILENKEVFGIPLILYMVLALNVDIEKESSIVDVYDQIFSLKRGGIYDRCYDIEHRINSPEIKRHIHRISQRIAFWIFENKADEAFISQEEFEEICEKEMSESGEKGEEIQSDTLIGNFFKLKHCEGKGTDELQFVHRSIYEYFVTVYFFESIHKLKSKEEVAGKLGELLKDGQLSEQMLEFIKRKFDSMEGYSLSDITKDVFNIMLRDDMTYYARGKYKNIIVREINIFSNMLEVVQLWNTKLGKLDNNIVLYLQYNHLRKLNLSGANLNKANLSGAYLIGADLFGADLNGVDLSRADLGGANLIGADLIGADLIGVDLDGADLIGANLSGAYLSGADLRGAHLNGAHLNGAGLRGANLSGADLSGADLSGADFEGADLNGAIFDEKQIDELYIKYNINDSRIYISETNDVISYKEYCARQHQKKEFAAVRIFRLFKNSRTN